MSARFIHLRLHTEYSLVDSVVRVPELIEAVAACGMPAVAVTDQSNLFALVKFYRQALQRGVQPIIGVDLLVREAGERAVPTRITLLCQNTEGYGNITRLVSRACVEGHSNGVATIDRRWLTAELLSGLIALSCATEGDVGRALGNGRETEAERALDCWLGLFGDRYYIELQRLGRPDEEAYIASAIALASRRGVPVVATNDVRFLKPEDFESHEARVCIHDGTLLADKGRRRKYTRQQYLRSPQEMAALFADVPEALANTLEIARRCSLVLKLGASRLPDFPTPNQEPVEDYLRRRSQEGLAARLVLLFPDEATRAAEKRAYEERLEFELKTIIQMGFAGYFLIVADFINWAQANGVPVGPGRGSGAGSLVAYVLGITGLDPLRYELLFERFLNPERVSMPDFDIDFCQDGRDRVIDYVKSKYGAECVAQIATFGTMAAKAVVRDCGRVLGMSYGYVDRIAKLIPFELGITLDAALEKEPELKRLYGTDEEIKTLMDLARSLEGLTRNVGMHAGGVLIAPGRLTDFTPLYVAEGSEALVSQFDKDDVEQVGLVKFDFLGLTTLTIIAEAVRNIHALGRTDFDIEKIPLDDPAAYQVFSAGNTVAIFQFESRGMRDLIMKARPDRLEDLIALNALYRPGPMDLIPEFIERKHRRQQWEYLDPRLKEILEPTYGVMTYQEHVMTIAQVIGGYTLGGADLLRRAMGKKKAEEMAKQRAIFLKGATERGLSESRANILFDQMEKFAGYGFNKSHSAAYSLVAYQTAYLKAHHTAAFMAANLSSVMNDTDKVVTIIRDCREIGLEVTSPDINASLYRFAVAGEKTVRYGLGAVRGVGEGAVEALIAERAARGPFKSLEDLCRRTDPQKLNKRMLEALIRSGSFDSFGANRATLMHSLPAAMQLGDQNARASLAGQVDFFGLAAGTNTERTTERRAAEQPEWSEAVRLQGERDTLGLYLTGHPIARFEADLARFVSHRINHLMSEKPVGGGGGFNSGKPVMIAGLIDEIRKRGPRTVLNLDDRTGRMEVSMFDEQFQKYRQLIVKDAIILAEGKARFDEFSNSWRMTAQRITELDKLREQNARRLVLAWPQTGEPDALMSRMMEILGSWRGGPCPITIEYRGSGAAGAFTLGQEWNVKATRELIDQMEGLLGRDSVQIIYGAPPAVSMAAN